MVLRAWEGARGGSRPAGVGRPPLVPTLLNVPAQLRVRRHLLEQPPPPLARHDAPSTAAVLWANLHLLLLALARCRSVTGWMGEHHDSPVPVAVYGAVLLMAAMSRTTSSWRTIIQRRGSALEAPPPPSGGRLSRARSPPCFTRNRDLRSPSSTAGSRTASTSLVSLMWARARPAHAEDSRISKRDMMADVSRHGRLWCLPRRDRRRPGACPGCGAPVTDAGDRAVLQVRVEGSDFRRARALAARLRAGAKWNRARWPSLFAIAGPDRRSRCRSGRRRTRPLAKPGALTTTPTSSHRSTARTYTAGELRKPGPTRAAPGRSSSTSSSPGRHGPSCGAWGRRAPLPADRVRAPVRALHRRAKSWSALIESHDDLPGQSS